MRICEKHRDALQTLSAVRPCAFRENLKVPRRQIDLRQIVPVFLPVLGVAADDAYGEEGEVFHGADPADFIAEFSSTADASRMPMYSPLYWQRSVA